MRWDKARNWGKDREREKKREGMGKRADGNAQMEARDRNRGKRRKERVRLWKGQKERNGYLNDGGPRGKECHSRERGKVREVF